MLEFVVHLNRSAIDSIINLLNFSFPLAFLKNQRAEEFWENWNEKELNLKDASLTEEQMKHYILDDYTFLKRPVILFGNHIFIGNAKATIENAKNTIKN